MRTLLIASAATAVAAFVASPVHAKTPGTGYECQVVTTTQIISDSKNPRAQRLNQLLENASIPEEFTQRDDYNIAIPEGTRNAVVEMTSSTCKGKGTATPIVENCDTQVGCEVDSLGPEYEHLLAVTITTCTVRMDLQEYETRRRWERTADGRWELTYFSQEHVTSCTLEP